MLKGGGGGGGGGQGQIALALMVNILDGGSLFSFFSKGLLEGDLNIGKMVNYFIINFQLYLSV